ncbi:MAG TPA: hypothetical protein GXZ67_01220 [Clostridiaceae bacterium]|jgi:hypothetical protein|nr:hypothetical protein [Clostridiaceae bacterium]
MEKYQIMMIRINHRINSAESLQKVLTRYGCNIKTRLGLHEAGDVCGVDGLIILQLVKTDMSNTDFLSELSALEGIEAKLCEV